MSDDSTNLRKYLDKLSNVQSTVVLRGRVREVTGLIVRASLPDAVVGDLVEIYCKETVKLAEVVGFKDELTVLMPLDGVKGIGPDAEVQSTGSPLSIKCGPQLLGRVLDGLGRPIDQNLLPINGETYPITRTPPDPLTRARITSPLSMGIRAIDGLLTIGRGQRVGVFASAGVGKSQLMGQIARGCAADVVVICLVGERGREVRAFIESTLDDVSRQRTVVICATSDTPALVRIKSAQVATTIAEWFRDQGQHVLLMMDSLTRFARAQREVGLAAGEPPVRRGYPPSVFSMLPRLLERTGNDACGSITALYTVLVAGDDMDEPIADEVRGLLDGHIVLDRNLAARNHWPAIDILASLSRVMSSISSSHHLKVAAQCREVLAIYHANQDLIRLGAYIHGTDAKIDFAIDLIEDINNFLKQNLNDFTPFDDTIEQMLDIFF